MAKAKKTKSGRWRVQLYLGRTPEGKQIIKSITADTKREAEARAAEYKARGAKPSKQTVQDAISEYISLKSAVISPATVRSYNANFRALKRTAPALMQTKVDSVDTKKAQQLINSLTEQYAPASVKSFYKMFEIAMHAKGLRFEGILLPRIPKKERYIPTLETARQIFRAAQGTELEIPIILAAAGLRAGEICGLHPEDFDGEYLHICRAKVSKDKGSYIEKIPKTPTSDRYIKIPAGVYEMVMQRGYITHMRPDSLSIAHKKFLKKNGFQHFRLHDWRHFMVSSLHAVGCSDAFIMAQGGWASDFTMKRVYRHIMVDSAPAMADKAVNQIASLLPGPGCGEVADVVDQEEPRSEAL